MRNGLQEYAPNSTLDLEIKTLRDSSVFLLAVDQKVAYGGTHDITRFEVQKAMRNKQQNLNTRLFNVSAFILTPSEDCNTNEKIFLARNSQDQSVQTTNNDGVTGDTDLLYDDDSAIINNSPKELIEDEIEEDVKATDEIVVIEENDDELLRKYFPDIWIDENIIATEETFMLQKRLPDTITSWKLSAFAIHPKQGLSIAEPRFIKTTKNTYLEVNVPKVVRLGDVFKVSFRPMTQKANRKNKFVEVTLDDHDGAFEYINEIQAGRSNCFNYSPSNSKKELVQMDKNGKFLIRMIKDGHQKLTMKATIDGVDVDTVELDINVLPNGIREYKSKSVFIDLNDQKSSFSTKVKIDIPAGAKLVNIEASLDGNLLGSAIKNFDEILTSHHEEKDPLMKFGQDIVAYKYLNESGKLDEELRKKIKLSMDEGYTYIFELSMENGAFTREVISPGNCIWLTSFVVQLLSEAREIIEVDDDLITSALKYLVEKQEENGSFLIDHEAPHFDQMQGNNEMPRNYITAFTTLAFLMNPNYNPSVMEHALDYLSTTAKLQFDLDKSLTAYAFALANRNDNATRFLKNIKRNFRTNPKNFEKHSLFAEAASYTTLAGLKLHQTENVTENTEWLLNNKVSMSQYDELISNKAISGFLLLTNIGTNGINMKISRNGEEKLLKIRSSHEIDNAEFSQVNGDMTFNIKANGSGMSVANIRYEYIIREEPTKHFKIEANTKTVSMKEISLQVEITAFKDSSRTEVEIYLPSGYDFKSYESKKAIVSMKKI